MHSGAGGSRRRGLISLRSDASCIRVDPRNYELLNDISKIRIITDLIGERLSDLPERDPLSDLISERAVLMSWRHTGPLMSDFPQTLVSVLRDGRPGALRRRILIITTTINITSRSHCLRAQKHQKRRQHQQLHCHCRFGK